MNTYENHSKLRPIVHTSLSSLGFYLDVRMPGWLPDEVTTWDPSSTSAPTCRQIFVEEVLGGSTVGAIITRLPFQPPLIDSGPISDNTRWILGYDLKQVDHTGNEVPVGSYNDFNKYLHELLIRIRRYNAALYRLRRLHLFVEGNQYQMGSLPGENIYDPATAEANYALNLRQLREHIGTTIVDMIEVNGYIVSTRVVMQIFAGGIGIMSPQPVGSSSSHLYVSSPFLSSSSASPP